VCEPEVKSVSVLKHNIIKVRGGGEAKHHAFMMSELRGSAGLALRSDELNLIIKNGYSLMTGIWFRARVAQPVSSPIGGPSGCSYLTRKLAVSICFK